MAKLQKQIRKIRERAEWEAEGLRIEKQLFCKHRNVVECEHYITTPIRVCEVCGFAERGWNCGYQILTKACRIVSRDVARASVLGHVHPNRRFVRDGDIYDRDELYRRAVVGEPEIG